MKRIFTLFLAIIMTITIQAQIVPEEQQSLITKVTATWCGNCGTWGWSFYEDISADNDDKALMMKAHYSGDLQNSIGQEMGTNFNITGQPRFFVNNTDQNITPSNTTTKRTEVANAVNDIASQTPIVNAAVDVTITVGEINFEVKTKFFAATSGEYYTNVYIVEDNVIANQSGQSTGANTSHQDVVRGAVDANTFGQLVVDGSAGMNMEVNHSYVIQTDPTWDIENLEFIAVVWSKSEGVYSFENGSSSTNVVISSTEDIADEIDLSVKPTLLEDETTVSLTLEEQTDLSINLYDLNGKVVRQIQQGNLPTGNHQFTIQKDNLAAGMYIVNIQTAKGIATKKIIVQ